MKTESNWEYDTEKKAFVCGAMTAEIHNQQIALYVMDKKFLEFGDVYKLEEFVKLLNSLKNCIA